MTAEEVVPTLENIHWLALEGLFRAGDMAVRAVVAGDYLLAMGLITALPDPSGGERMELTTLGRRVLELKP